MYVWHDEVMYYSILQGSPRVSDSQWNTIPDNVAMLQSLNSTRLYMFMWPQCVLPQSKGQVLSSGTPFTNMD